jgi:Leucine-rich repeat (LRR) protein
MFFVYSAHQVLGKVIPTYPQYVVSLAFKPNSLTDIPENVFTSLHYLRTLTLTDNQLTALPDAIGQCPELETLVLTNNRLSRLPDSLVNCRIVHLDISKNHFTKFPQVCVQ